MIKYFDQSVPSQYTGVWYEIARVPTAFEPLLRCGTATNTLNCNGTLTILNQGIIAPGQNYTAQSLATVINPKVPATLSVVFENGKCISSFPPKSTRNKIILGGVGSYSILETDYKSYSAEYACFPIPNVGNVQFAFIIS